MSNKIETVKIIIFTKVKKILITDCEDSKYAVNCFSRGFRTILLNFCYLKI